jgi:nucleoprotein TPR
MSEQQQPTDAAPASSAGAAPAVATELPGPSDPPQASTNSGTAPEMESDTQPDAAAIRRQVEQEHALADAEKKLRDLEGEVQRIRGEKRDVETERDGAG